MLQQVRGRTGSPACMTQSGPARPLMQRAEGKVGDLSPANAIIQQMRGRAGSPTLMTSGSAHLQPSHQASTHSQAPHPGSALLGYPGEVRGLLTCLSRWQGAREVQGYFSPHPLETRGGGASSPMLMPSRAGSPATPQMDKACSSECCSCLGLTQLSCSHATRASSPRMLR